MTLDKRPGPGVLEGLRVIERLVRLEIARLRASGIPAGRDEYRGLYVSDEEVDEILSSLSGEEAPVVAAAAQVAALERRLAHEREQLAALVEEAGGRLGRLIHYGQLNAFETGCVLLCLALEGDLRFERLFAYVQDDVTKRRPRVELAWRLLCAPEGRAAARAALGANAPLRRRQIITLRDEPGHAPTPLPAQYLSLDPRIAAFLLDQDGLDAQLRTHAALLAGPAELPAYPAPLAERLARLAALPATRLEPPVVQVFSRGGEAQPVARHLGHAAGLPLLSVNFPPLAAALGLETAWAAVEREAVLQPAAVLLANLHALKPEETDRLYGTLKTDLAAPLVVLATEGGTAWPGLNITLPAPDFHLRRVLWARGLGPEMAEAAEALASKFRLSGEQIEDALRSARGQAVWRDPANPQLALDDLYAAARAHSTPILSGLARKITPRFTWDDIILPAETLQHLQEMCTYVDYRHVVYKRWGFERKLALGKGLMALFAGESGTGKTMAADILAGALGLDLYKIDLSAVVSKYIGETEKNLNRIFQEAETSNAILFFDEADALFGKRSEVKDAHDRYANIETAYLLQKMEEYEGVVILATNLKMNLDDAFLRRMHFVVEFPLPEEDDRRRIWEAALPPELPRAANVDLARLARKFKLTGGNIRNIALSAAFLAAADGQVLTMPHLLHATRREFQKIGRMVTAGDFEDDFNLAAAEG